MSSLVDGMTSTASPGGVTTPRQAASFGRSPVASTAVAMQGPATAPQPCYQVRLWDGTIEVRDRR